MTDTLQATLPERVGGRDEARQFLVELLTGNRSLAGFTVSIHGDALRASGSSFIDELIKKLLVESNADKVIFEEAPPQAANDAEMSAKRRGVVDRLIVHRR